MNKTELDTVLRLIRAAPFDAALPVAVVRKGLDRFAEAFPVPAVVTQTSTTLTGVSAETLTVERDGPIVLYLHGGGYVIGSPRSHRHLTAKLALEIRGTVLCLDYRLGQESPFPAALDDALAAWRKLASRYSPERCAVAGDSAGGGLGLAMLVRARAAGLPMRGCLVGFSPWVNLGTENRSYDRLAAVDPMLSREVVEYFVSRYAPTINRRDPGISPLFAGLEGLPPTLIQIGDHECFFGDATLMHEALIAASAVNTLSCDPILHLYLGYARKLSEVASDQNALVCQRMSSDPKIVWSNRCSSSSQIRAQLTLPKRYLGAQCQSRKALKKSVDSLHSARFGQHMSYAIGNFASRHHRKRGLPDVQRFEAPQDCRILTLYNRAERVSVQQILDSHYLTRVLLRIRLDFASLLRFKGEVDAPVLQSKSRSLTNRFSFLLSRKVFSQSLISTSVGVESPART